ncbi:MAG: GNAT family N-acetyltransferase [Bacteroidetes bacterium QS_9_68_14]|nr:MAG: GNAT family N-acetyltransferase [Bacteroidetes bacterium QS_9_68_14]
MPVRARSDASEALRIAPVESRAAWQDAKALRRRVFVEEQDCPPAEEFDGHDPESRHLLGRTPGGEAVAVARWRAVRLDGGTPAAKLERFAVAPEHRSNGYGQALVRRAIEEAEQAGLAAQVVHAQAHLEDFYARFGFERRGAGFEEVGIPHVEMVRYP